MHNRMGRRGNERRRPGLFTVLRLPPLLLLVLLLFGLCP
jgi:hypothetical protein